MGISELLSNNENNKKIEKLKNGLGEFDLIVFEKLKELCIRTFNDFWSNEDGAPSSKEEMVTFIKIIGLDTLTVFLNQHSAAQDYIALNDPSWTRLVPPYTTEELIELMR